MAIVSVASFFPMGFNIWFIAAPMLSAAFILAVQTLARGRTAQALALMVCHVLVMPPVVAFGPSNAPVGPDAPVDGSSTSSGEGSQGGGASSLTPKLEELKQKMARSRAEVARWLSENLAEERDSGYLSTNSEKDVDLETRRAIQQENLWRGEVFAEISRITGRPVAEIAATYAKLNGKSRATSRADQ
jgi:hypothetical protein